MKENLTNEEITKDEDPDLDNSEKKFNGSQLGH